jgi:hypothetical protein
VAFDCVEVDVLSRAATQAFLFVKSDQLLDNVGRAHQHQFLPRSFGCGTDVQIFSGEISLDLRLAFGFFFLGVLVKDLTGGPVGNMTSVDAISGLLNRSRRFFSEKFVISKNWKIRPILE